MRTEGFASSLTVWAGSVRYDFVPGRDVLVGYGPGCDIPLERLANVTPPPGMSRQDVVLRFTGTHWVAIDLSRNGVFVDGVRVSTADIRDGQAITVGDPERGPRLVFQVAPAPGPPGQPHRPGFAQGPTYPPPQIPAQPGRPHQPNDPNLRVPTQRATQQMPVAPTRAPTPGRPIQPPPTQPSPPLPPSAPSPPPAPPPVAAAKQPKAKGLIERMVTGKLRAPRPSFRTESGNSTYRLPLRAGARTIGVTAYQLGLAVDGHQVLTDISFMAHPGTLLAVAGPSAARNTALLGLLAGARKPSSGRTTVDGHDVHAEPEAMRTHIGMVSRDDRLHRHLTVERALGYAAELRLPPDTPPEHRDRVVNQVLDEVQLSPHRATRIGKLPPELRRCTAMAIELVTRPTLLVVDGPGAGLDAAQQNHVMAILRRQADIGCVVVVAMSSATSLPDLNMCDQVLLLTSTGTTAFLGAPLQIESSLGTADWSTALAEVSADPDGAHRAFRAQPPTSALTTPPEVAAPQPLPAELAIRRQIRFVARREVRLLFANRLYLFFLAVLPLVLAALTLSIPGDSGLDRPRAGSTNPHQAIEILAALNIAAVIVGSALTIGALVGQRRVFRREQALGLSASAYLAAKILVYSLAAAILTAIVFVIVVAVEGGPVNGAVLLHNATVELYVSVAATAIVSAVVGLALSTLGKSLREVLPLVVPVVLVSALFNGSLVPLVSKWVLEQISWFVPAQWGFAASASTVDLRRLDALAADAEMWTHYSGWWVFDLVMLTLFGAIAAGLTRYRLRPPARRNP